MDVAEGGILLNNAFSQADRMRETPDPTRVQLDPRGESAVLADFARRAELFRFYDLTNRPNGDWAKFFQADPLFVRAMLACIDLRRIEADFQRLLSQMRAAPRDDVRLDLSFKATALVLKLCHLLVQGGAPPRTLEEALRRLHISDRDQALGDALRSLALHLGGRSLEDLIGLESQGHQKGWFDAFILHLDDAVAALLTVLHETVADMQHVLDPPAADGQHAPQAALAVTFVRLFAYAQATMNDIPRRVLEFYRSQIVRQEHREAVPDQVYLAFTPEDGQTGAAIPRSSVFASNTGAADAQLCYAADHALSVHAAPIRRLRTLRVLRDTMQDQRVPALAARVLSGIATYTGATPFIEAAFPVFGAETTGQFGPLKSADASLGLMLSGYALRLDGGRRHMRVAISLTTQSLSRIDRLLQDIGVRDPPKAEAALATLCKCAFALQITTPEGWLQIKRFGATCTGAPALPRIEFDFVLDTDGPPCAALPPTAPGDDAYQLPRPDRPALALLLQNTPMPFRGHDGLDRRVFPYTLLSLVSFSDIAVQVSVDGLAPAGIETPDGMAPASAPVPVFGATASPPAAMRLHVPEIAGRKLGEIAVCLEWQDFPPDGLKAHYAGYTTGQDGKPLDPECAFAEAAFRARLHMGQSGAGPADTQTLFSAGTAAAPARGARSVITLRRNAAEPAPADGALTVTLTEPPHGFGQAAYARSIAASAQRYETAKALCMQACEQRFAASAPRADATAALLRLHEAATAIAPSAQPQALGPAIDQAVLALTAMAVASLRDAVGRRGDVSDEVKAGFQARLTASLGWVAEDAALARPGQTALRPKLGAADIATNLREWLAGCRSELGHPDVQAELDSATCALGGTSLLATARADGAGQPDAAAGVIIAAAVQGVQAALAADRAERLRRCVQAGLADLPLPPALNPPWRPVAVRVRISYQATASLRDPEDGFTVAHLAPFGLAEPIGRDPDGEMRLLWSTPLEGALYIDFAAAVPATDLLLLLAPGPGLHRDAPARPQWAQQLGPDWQELDVPGDDTDGLRRSGIVRLACRTPAAGTTTRLRLAVAEGAGAFPLLSGLACNALRATGVLAPGSDGGRPLPAGSPWRAMTDLPGIGSICQVGPSFGGRPALQGEALSLWLAERARHKGYAIQGGDYARLVLSEFPSLWQVAVLPVTGDDGSQAAGHVRLVVVPGPDALPRTNPTMPRADSRLLDDIGSMLRARISPFARVSVVNPAYRRIKVFARLRFDGGASDSAYAARLNEELIAWLSPWPQPSLGKRPASYYRRNAIAAFLRGRPYVRALVSLSLDAETEDKAGRFQYATSAARHHLVPDTEAALRRSEAMSAGPPG
jgi:hypothetical protein